MWICNACPKTFRDEASLDRHQASKGHILINFLACPICSKEFQDETALNQHQISRGHRGMWTCKDCEKQFGGHMCIYLCLCTHNPYVLTYTYVYIQILCT